MSKKKKKKAKAERPKSRKSAKRQQRASAPKQHDACVTLLLREGDYSLTVALPDGDVEQSYNFDHGGGIDVNAEAEDVAYLIMARHGHGHHLIRQTLPSLSLQRRADPVEVATALMRFACNASYEEFTAVYGDEAVSPYGPRSVYLMGKLDLMRTNLSRFIAELDGTNRARFVRLALARYRQHN